MNNNYTILAENKRSRKVQAFRCLQNPEICAETLTDTEVSNNNFTVTGFCFNNSKTFLSFR